MEAQKSARRGVDRRDLLKVAVGSVACGAALLTQSQQAYAQSASDIDALNLILNLEYLLAQFTSTVAGETVPLDRLVGNGVPGTAPIAGRALTFVDRTVLLPIIREMSADSRNHLLPIRTVVGALSVRQPLIDISVSARAPFSVAMQRAGVVAPGAVFDPYESEENMLYAMFYLKNISVSAYRGMTATVTNRVVTQNFTGLLGTEAIHAATIRSYLYARGATAPRIRENTEKIATFQRTLNGAQVFQGVAPSLRSYPGGTVQVRVANIAPAQGNGDVGGLTAGRLLNQLYLTNTAATSGGFFPEGVNGTIRSSASA